MLAWYVVQTNPRCECRAQLGLEQAGYLTLLPVEHVTVNRRRRGTRQRVLTRIERVLFPRYVLVAVDHETQGFYSIRLTDGVQSILSNGGIPLVIKDSIVAKLRTAMLAGAFDEPEKKRPSFKAGQQVKIIEGELAGFVAKVRQTSSKERVKLLLEGSLVDKVEVPLEHVELLCVA